MTTTPPPMPEPRKYTTDFIRKTNDEYAAWCKAFYQPEALDERGMVSLHGLWAWQEQEQRITALESDRKMLREALEAMQRHVEELCTVYGVPLPQATFDKASTALMNTHD